MADRRFIILFLGFEVSLDISPIKETNLIKEGDILVIKCTATINRNKSDNVTYLFKHKLRDKNGIVQMESVIMLRSNYVRHEMSYRLKSEYNKPMREFVCEVQQHDVTPQTEKKHVVYTSKTSSVVYASKFTHFFY